MKLIKIPIYDAKVYFFTDKEMFNSHFSDFEDEFSDFACWNTGTEISILSVNKWGDCTDPRFLQGLTHECNHAAMDVLKNVGVKMDFDNQEPLCYLQDYIFRRCYEHCLKLEEKAA